MCVFIEHVDAWSNYQLKDNVDIVILNKEWIISIHISVIISYISLDWSIQSLPGRMEELIQMAALDQELGCSLDIKIEQNWNMEHDIITRDAYSVFGRNPRFFKVAMWHYRCRHNLENNCIWDNLQCCLLVPKSPSKPVMLTFDLQSRKTIMILAFIDETLPLQFAPGAALS